MGSKMKTEKYVYQYGQTVTVVSAVKGQHDAHCLCFADCVHFHPNEKDNCHLAQTLYELHCAYGLVVPVYECPDYERT